MKNALLAITLLITGISFAQQEEKIFIEKGRWALGGGFSLNSSENEDIVMENLNENFGFTVAPKIGYSIANNWLLGLKFMYHYSDQNNSNSTFSNNEAIDHSVGGAPFIQKFFPVFNKFSFHLQGSLEYERRWRELSSSSRTEKYVTNYYSVAIRPGFTYFLGEHFALEASTGILRYSRLTHEKEDMEMYKSQNLNLDFGLSNIHFGAFYYF